MSDLEDLYQSVILDHDRAPRNYGRAEPETHRAQAYNPLCGDSLTVSLTVCGDTLQTIKFEANSCAIARASASLMTEALSGNSIARAREIAAAFDLLLRGQPSEAPSTLEALQGVRSFPTRIRCAKLPWKALLEALQ